MLRTASLLFVLAALTTVLVGCGSGGSPLAPDPSPDPPAAGGGSATHQVGPLVIDTASAAGFVAQDIPVQDGISLVALHGSRINYLASQAMLDRIVFASDRDGAPGDDIWVCDLDGSDAVQLTGNDAVENAPCWSPDGTMVAFGRQWPGQDYEIMLMTAGGSEITALTSNTDEDLHPSFGPVGRRIVFESDRNGNYEIYTMFRNGTTQTNITTNSAHDRWPDWSPQFTDPTILFCSKRDAANYEIYEVNPDGTNVNRRTNTPANEFHPDHDPQGDHMTELHDGDVFVRAIGSGAPYDFSASPATQQMPSWSSDGRFICYASYATGDADLVLQETEEPYSKFALTGNTRTDTAPDLGSPTMQTDRVLIGPAGSDWGGSDPIWSSAYAAIAAFSTDGYENLVRIGISAAHVGSLQISPLSRPATIAPGRAPAGVVIEAAKIVNLREDAGRGLSPTVWDLDPLGVTAAILYFHPDTGKLVSVLALRDATYPSAAGAPAAVTERVEGNGLVVEGDFAAVFDASGNRLAGPSSQVTIGADGAVNAN